MTNQIFHGNCIEVLKTLPEKSVDLIFADPPYFMQTEGALLRTTGEKFSGVEDAWDKFESLSHYDEFSKAWITECRRVLKDNGSFWVIGSFQNIFRLGYILQNLGFWILNDVVWNKPNPVPNFKGTRLCNAHETLIWAIKNKNAKYTFNYKTMKFLNQNKQEKSVWNIGICIGNERLKDENGKKIHSTQKPEQLLEKVILTATKPDDLILDPFFGTGTTGAAAKKLGRFFIGIEENETYIKAAEKRIANIQKDDIFLKLIEGLETKPPRVSLNDLEKAGFLYLNQAFFNKQGDKICIFIGNNQVKDDFGDILSIHQMSAKHLKKANHNGWDYFYILENNELLPLNTLRYRYFEKNN